MKVMRHAAGIGFWMALTAAWGAQAPAPRSVLGTVAGFKPEIAAIEVRRDSGETEVVRMGLETQVQRVAPGEKDLRKAAAMKATDIAIGDRVLVSWAGGATEARRIIVMDGDEISKKREADRQDWQKRGLAGVVDGVRGNEITLKSRSFAGERAFVIAVTEKTAYRRYKPDSVKFADAAISRLAEVKKGDQLRGRGTKSQDGTRVDADEIVFGSFLTKAGTVTAVDVERSEVTIKDLETGRALSVRVTADSQLKRMPAMGGMRPGGMGPGGPGGMGPGGPGSMGPGGAGGGAPDLAQMLERMPAGKVTDLKVGESIIASSTRGAAKDQITAIMLLGNAEMLIQMATASSNSRTQGMGGMMGGSMGGSGAGMIGSLELPGVIP
jgi:hypothetical protein